MPLKREASRKSARKNSLFQRKIKRKRKKMKKKMIKEQNMVNKGAELLKRGDRRFLSATRGKYAQIQTETFFSESRCNSR